MTLLDGVENMKTKFLTLNKPCHEKWENMTPNEKGSFCHSCSKDVIDFTRLSQLEISEIMKKSDGNICARVTNTQLRTPLFNLEDEKKNFIFPYSKVAAGLMFASTLAVSLPACTDSSKVYTVEVATTNIDLNSNSKKNKKEPKKDESNTFVYFKGKVIAGDKGVPVENVKISHFTISNILTTYTAANGKFVLKIPRNLIDKDNVIRVSYDESKIKSGSNHLKGHKEVDYILKEAELMEEFLIETYNIPAIMGMIECIETKATPDPIIIYNCKKITHKKLKSIYNETSKNNTLESKEMYYFGKDAAVALYGEDAEYGLYILTEKPIK